MNCPNCGQEVLSGDRFCIGCGLPLSDDSPPQEEASSQEEPTQAPTDRQDSTAIDQEVLTLQNTVATIRGELSRLRDSLAIVDQRLLELRAGAQPSVTRKPIAQSAPPLSEATPSTGLVPPWVARPPFFRGISIDWEHVLGRNWFAIIGALALTIGVGFFLKLAFDNNWIGETGRIILGIVVGLALVGAGEYTHRRYPLWAQPVTGGGIAVLYLSIYAAFGLYELIDFVPAFLFLALVGVFSVLLALRHESLVIALMGIVGAFLAPILLGAVLGPDLAEADLPNEHWLLLYVLVVGAGVLAVSTFRNWRWFSVVGIVGSYVLLGLWTEGFSDRNAVLAQLGLSGVLLEFIGATTLFHILWRRPPDPVDLALMTLNAVGYFSLTFVVMWDQYEEWFGLITLGLSLVYGLVAYAALRRTGTPMQVSLFALAIAVVFLTVAVPLQLTGNWIAVAWAAEGAVISAVGFYVRSHVTRGFALAILATAVVRLLVFDTSVELEGFQPVLNDRFATFVVAIASFYVAAFLFWRDRAEAEAWEAHVYRALVVAANFLTLWLFSAEVIAFFDSRDLSARSIENWQHLTLTVMWALYAGGLLVVAATQRSALLRWGGLALLTAPVIKLLLIDTFVVDLDPLTFWPVINFGFLTFVLVLAMVLVAAYTYWRQREQLEEQERFIFLALLVVASAVSLWVFSVETVRFFDAREVKVGTETSSQLHLTLTVLWALYAVGAVAVGIVRQSSQIRLAGIVLLAVPVAKLFVYDTFLLERGYRVAAFVTLGGVLLAMGFVYQRYSQEVRGFLFGSRA